MLFFLQRSLQGAEHQRSHHQVEEHHGEDQQQGGAAHGCTAAQSELSLVPLSDGASIPAAAAETSATTEAHGFYSDHTASESGSWLHTCLQQTVQLYQLHQALNQLGLYCTADTQEDGGGK